MEVQGDFRTIHCAFGDVGAWCKPLYRYSLTKGKWEKPQSEKWKYLMELNFDKLNVVALKSSKHIEKVTKENNIEINTRTISGGHHNIASDKKMVKGTVDITLEPKREKSKSEGR